MLTFLLNRTYKSLLSYIRDSTDFVNKISELHDLPDVSLLLTLDIASLYTNISHVRGLNALRHYLSARCDVIPPSELLVDMASYVLKYNYFSFDKDLWYCNGFDFCP